MKAPRRLYEPNSSVHQFLSDTLIDPHKQISVLQNGAAEAHSAVSATLAAMRRYWASCPQFGSHRLQKPDSCIGVYIGVHGIRAQ